MGVSCTYSLKRLCKRHDEGTPLSNDATRFTPCLRTSSTGGQPLQDLWNNHFELSTSSNNINPVPTHHKEPGQYCTTMCHSRYCFFLYLPNLKPCGTGFQIPHLDVPSCCSSPWTAIPWAWMTFGDPGPSPAKWVASFKHADALGLAVTSSNERAITININKHTWDILRFWYSWKLWNPKQGLPD